MRVPCLRVPRRFGGSAIRLLDRLRLRDRQLRIQRDGVYVYIPLLQEPNPEDLAELEERLPEFEVLTREFREARKPKTLVEILEGRLPPHLLASLPRSLDLIGDVAILEIPPELEPHKRLIGDAVMQLYGRIKTVLAKAGAVEGVYRLRNFEVIAGSGETETVHREYGCVYHLDPTKVYFSPRLSYEHHRVAAQVRGGETVVDMFAGVGPFSILIAKMHRNVKVYAIDINPEAIRYLRMNVERNGVEDRVTVLEGDAGEVIESTLAGVADRVVMNLPERALEYVGAACMALGESGGVIHYYEFSSEPDALEKAEKRLRDAVKRAGRRVSRVLAARRVREVAPLRWQVVIDAEIA